MADAVAAGGAPLAAFDHPASQPGHQPRRCQHDGLFWCLPFAGPESLNCFFLNVCYASALNCIVFYGSWNQANELFLSLECFLTSSRVFTGFYWVFVTLTALGNWGIVFFTDFYSKSLTNIPLRSFSDYFFCAVLVCTGFNGVNLVSPYSFRFFGFY